MTPAKRKTMAITAVLLLILFAVATQLFPATSLGYTKVAGFRYVEPLEGSCAALSPGCGYCPGTVINKQCYVRN